MEAIVLRSVRIGDSRMIVDMFTREAGHLSLSTSLPKSRRGGQRRQLLQPLTFLSIEADVRASQTVHPLRDASLLLPMPSLQGEPVKLAVTVFLSEFLCHALRSEQPNAPLFSYICSSLEWLDASTAPPANFHIVFLMRLARFLGFQPNLDGEGDFFDLRAATFCQHPPLHPDFLGRGEASHIRTLMRMDYATMHLFRLSRQQRKRIVEVITTFYRLHIPQFPELRSPAVLSELFE